MVSREPFDPHTTKWSDVNLFKFGALITVSSTIENVIFYPFYVLKTREQSDRRNLTLLQSFRYHLRTTLSKSNYATQGSSLYRGFWFSNMASIPAYGIYLGVYISTKDQLNASTNISARFYAPFIAGAIADVVSILFYVPSDVIVQRLQIANSPYKSTSDAVRKIYVNEGLKGYYRGLGATFIVSILASSIWWTAYENVKLLLYRPSILPYLVWSKSSDDKKTEIHRIPQFTAGFIAGTITSTCVNPLDVVKTRIQTQNLYISDTKSSPIMYKNMFHGLRCLWHDEGVHGLLRGVLPKLISRGPLSAISALIFELVLYYSRNDIHPV
ncbi:unnamed protein product [Rotaria sordida]|uniref:Mitoferrin-1 n=1 Tax=Rotaria sordida TaxID=392033 RepID=A0A813PWP1_9BILA|nr:unnamed protein product [Rotaria sordida]CAF0729068.1 unnamed protein product [Rotaria sordida]CAF0757262.1 unnamed protein product [Rotaria sordida]